MSSATFSLFQFFAFLRKLLTSEPIESKVIELGPTDGKKLFGESPFITDFQGHLLPKSRPTDSANVRIVRPEKGWDLLKTIASLKDGRSMWAGGQIIRFTEDHFDKLARRGNIFEVGDGLLVVVFTYSNGSARVLCLTVSELERFFRASRHFPIMVLE